MIWGELQSVIQLAAALNAIYISLRDIRNPYVRSEERALLDLSSKITDMEMKGVPGDRTNLTRAAELLSDIYVEHHRLIALFDNADRIIGRICAAAIFIYIVLLIISSFCYGCAINLVFAFFVAVLGFLPITIGFGLNIRLVRQIRRFVPHERRKVEAELVPIATRPSQPSPEANRPV